MSELIIKFPEELFLLDLETTGLDPIENSIHEISCKQLVSEACWYTDKFRARTGTLVCEKATTVNGVDWTCLENRGRSWMEGMAFFFGWIIELREEVGKPIVFTGINVGQFDLDFLNQAWILLNGETKVPWTHRVLDLHSIIYLMAIAKGSETPAGGFSTSKLYDFYGLAPEPIPHNAKQGVEYEVELLTSALVEIQSFYKAQEKPCSNSNDLGIDFDLIAMSLRVDVLKVEEAFKRASDYSKRGIGS